MNEIAAWVPAFRAVVNCLGLVLFSLGMVPSARVALFRLPCEGGAKALPCRALARLLSHALPFALMAAAMVAVKCYGLRFFWDFVASVGIFTAYLLWLRRIGLRNSVYVSVIAFLVTDFCVALTNSIYRYGPVLDTLPKLVAPECVYAAAMAALCLFLRRYAPADATSIRPSSFAILLVSLLPYLVIRSSTFFYFLDGVQGRTLDAVLFLTIIATFAAFVGNYSAIRAASERARRLQLEMEVRERQKRYEVRRETMNEVNRRYHDMVKYARMRAQAGTAGSVDGYLEQRMTEDLSLASLQETGSGIVDMVLWEADERCRKEGLRLVAVVDARDTGFVCDYDLRTVVGNALDNAVEAAVGVEDPEKREVNVRMGRVNQMVFLRVENYFAGELRERAGRLLTTKGEGSGHGYGVENIRLAAERYGGSLAYERQGDRFVLTVMLPMP